MCLVGFLAHGFADDKLLGVSYTWPLFMHYLNAGYLSVMMFFCISGYVIGITNDQGKINIKNYLKKRAVRLYPVYMMALILCIIIAGSITLKDFIGNVLFAQNERSYFGLGYPFL